MNRDLAAHRRDRRLRKRLLQSLHAIRVQPQGGWVTGSFVYRLVEGATPGGQRFDSDIHALGLLRDLVNARYVEERDDRQRRQPVTLDVVSYRATAAGSAVAMEVADPDASIEDSRTE